VISGPAAPTVDEMDRIMQYLLESHEYRGALPMHLIVGFGLFSARRQGEILRLRWADLEPGPRSGARHEAPGE
jgi:integrase